MLASVVCLCASALAGLAMVLAERRAARRDDAAEAMKRREVEVQAIIVKNEAALASLLERMAKLEQSKAMTVIGGGIAAGARR